MVQRRRPGRAIVAAPGECVDSVRTLSGRKAHVPGPAAGQSGSSVQRSIVAVHPQPQCITVNTVTFARLAAPIAMPTLGFGRSVTVKAGVKYDTLGRPRIS